MKKILLSLISFLSGLANLTVFLLKKFNQYLHAVKIYLDKSECEKFKDCLFLAKLKAKQPTGADRAIEYPWIIENISIGQGKLLDVGSTACDMLSGLLSSSIEIHGLNLNKKIFKDKNIKFVQADIGKTPYGDNNFDCITCISTLEHIGVAGRYGSDEDLEGDRKAIMEMTRILKPGGELLVTVPYGPRDILPINKLYNKERINNLLNNFSFKIQYKKFNKYFNLWLETDENDAAQTDMIKDRWYAIALIRAIKK